MSVNKAILVGRLGRDPETRYTSGGPGRLQFHHGHRRNLQGPRRRTPEAHRMAPHRRLGQAGGDRPAISAQGIADLRRRAASRRGSGTIAKARSAPPWRSSPIISACWAAAAKAAWRPGAGAGAGGGEAERSCLGGGSRRRGTARPGSIRRRYSLLDAAAQLALQIAQQAWGCARRFASSGKLAIRTEKVQPGALLRSAILVHPLEKSSNLGRCSGVRISRICSRPCWRTWSNCGFICWRMAS